MKLMFASDIHGVASSCQQMLEAYRREGAQRLILLGDILYHGPRNGVAPGYDPQKVMEYLNDKAVCNQLLCVQGNCDAQVDQMVLNFPILAEYILLWVDGHTFYCTHGHRFTKEQLPMMGEKDILIYGHTHLQGFETLQGHLTLNPGSVSLPKGGNPATYMVYEDGVFTIKKMDGQTVQSVVL